MSNPLVSVIIPTFNSAGFVLQAINSVLNQTYSRIEIIVVDDGSTDETRQTLAELISHLQIRYVRQNNKGLSAARNTGIRLAGGRYIQFLDADDLLEPTKIEKQLEQLEQVDEPSISGCDFRHFDEGNPTNLYGGDAFKGKLPLYTASKLFEFETVIHRWLFPASLFDRFGNFEETPVREDWLLLWRLAANGVPFLYVNEPLALYRRHDNNMTCDFERMARQHLLTIERVDDCQKKQGPSLYCRTDLNALRESYHYELGLGFIRSNRIWGAWRELAQALLLASNRRQAKLLLLAGLPFFRTRSIDWARSADNFLWQRRATVRRGSRALFNRLSSLRKRFYQWRQRRPLRRLVSAGAFAVVWPLCWVGRRLLRFSRANTRRILVLHFGGLGDTLMLTPALAALKRAFPNAKLDLLTLHPHVRDAFANHPRITSVTTLSAYPGQWIISRFANLIGARLLMATVRYYPELLLKLITGRYDLAINFGLCDFDQRVGNALLYCLDIPTRVGARTQGDQFLTHTVNAKPGGCHRVDTYFDLLKPLGILAATKSYEYPISNEDVESVKLTMRDHGINGSRRLVVIHPGGKLHINSRRWPAKHFARVCDFLVREGFQVVLTGDKDDASVCAEVALSAENEIVSIPGILSLSETAALLSLCDLLITNDTATLHLSEAAQTPRVVSIFGPTDPAVLAPQNERHIVFHSNLPCAPCMGGTIDSNTERCWRDVKEECLWQTTPKQVIGVLRMFYEQPSARVARA